jgi:alcohol dehydrogenase class IV
MIQFEFSTASKIIFGSGSYNSIGKLAHELGTRALIIYGGPQEIMVRAIDLLKVEEVSCASEKINNEPTVDTILTLVESARSLSVNLILGIGGGSAIDSAKATAALLTNPGNITDYLEVVGANKPLLNPAAPLIAVPTTAGTGSEVTKNAVLGAPQYHVKVSLRSPYLLPRIALIDPELTLSLPSPETAFTGLDALTQLIEAYTSNASNPITDALCLEGIQRIARSIYRAHDCSNDILAREDMSIASLFSGIALANAKLGAVHGFAGPLGGELCAPHGAICACLLSHVMETNISALIERIPDHQVLERYMLIGKILTGDPNAKADAGLHWIMDFCLYSKVPPLSTYGLTEENFNTIIENAVNSSSMKGNPITLFKAELRNILQKSL